MMLKDISNSNKNKLINYYNEVQFVIMNIIGKEGFVKIFEDMSMYIILPDTKKFVANEIIKQIIKEFNKMFSELIGKLDFKIEHLIINYPDDTDNIIDLFSKLNDY